MKMEPQTRLEDEVVTALKEVNHLSKRLKVEPPSEMFIRGFMMGAILGRGEDIPAHHFDRLIKEIREDGATD